MEQGIIFNRYHFNKSTIASIGSINEDYVYKFFEYYNIEMIIYIYIFIALNDTIGFDSHTY